MGEFRTTQDERQLFWVERVTFSPRDFEIGLPSQGWVFSGGPFRTKLEAESYIRSMTKGAE